MFHATSRRHLMLQHSHLGPPYSATSEITLHCSLPLYHHFTPDHISSTCSTSHSHSPRLIPFHIHNYSTPHPHSTSQHISHHTIFHIALHHHILTVYITAPPHLTSQHIASFSTSDITLQSHSTLHNTTIPHHHWHFTSPHHNFPHLTLWQHFHIPGHHIPHHAIFHITHFSFQSDTPYLKLQHYTSHHISHTVHWHHTTFHIAPNHWYLGTPFHITPTFHITPRHAHTTTFRYKLHIPLSHSTLMTFQTTAMWCVIWWYCVEFCDMWCAVLCRKCRGWMWNVNLWWWDVECITHGHCISHLITLPPHFTLHHSTSSNTISDIPSHTTF